MPYRARNHSHQYLVIWTFVKIYLQTIKDYKDLEKGEIKAREAKKQRSRPNALLQIRKQTANPSNCNKQKKDINPVVSDIYQNS